MHILLLIVYGTLASVAVWKIPFLKKSGIRPGWLWVLFGAHVLTGWLHNRIAYCYFPDHGDIWNYFSLSFLYRHRLLSEFNLFLSDNSTWTYITHNGIVFIQMFLDLLSGNDMNVNTLLFAFPVFLGNVALFRVFRRRFPDDPLAAMTVFGLPSVLFWTACIYREGMLFMLLGFLFYHLDRLFTISTSPSGPKRVAKPSLTYSIALFLLIAYFRLAVAIILVPAILVWYWIEYPLPRPARRVVAIVLAMIITLAFSVPAVRATLLQVIRTEQASFLILEGHSRLPLPALDGTLNSVWRAFPAAIRNGFFEPLPGSGGQPIYLAFSIELFAVWLIILLAAIYAIRHPLAHTPAFPAACLLFALAGMLTIGFFVPFAGTIVRYRSIYLPFLLAPALHSLRNLRFIQLLNRWLANKL
jgi:hypothetical protein